MPIYHHDTDKIRDTLDIQVEGTAAVDRVVESNAADIPIWERNKAPLGWVGAWYPSSDGTYTPLNDSFLPFAGTTEFNAADILGTAPGERYVRVPVDIVQSDWEAIQPNPPEEWQYRYDFGYSRFCRTYCKGSDRPGLCCVCNRANAGDGVQNPG